MRVGGAILGIVSCGFLLLVPDGNAQQAAKEQQSVTSSADQSKVGQPARSQPPKAQTVSQQPAAPQPTKQQAKLPSKEKEGITFAENSGMFVKGPTPAPPAFNITNPKTAQEHFNVAVNYDHQKQVEKAIEHYRKALELKSEWAVAHYRLAQDLDKQGRTDDAISHWQEAVRYDPQLYLGYGRLAEAYYRQGNLKKAIEAYTHVLQYAPAVMATHYQLGFWYAELGDRQNAREHLQSYRELALKSKAGEAKTKRFEKATRELRKLKQ